jgi:hypothetical protein
MPDITFLLPADGRSWGDPGSAPRQHAYDRLPEFHGSTFIVVAAMVGKSRLGEPDSSVPDSSVSGSLNIIAVPTVPQGVVPRSLVLRTVVAGA